ncbi:hypothetical protein [Aeromicrobium sp. 179-A 4D2 NHS]|uniref:hypothetical protein n=1 Tax=Aeromicrobium sp. 179-A 4D2 NHS TaxID=3142375 RepID=UPI0039A05ADB
MLAFIGLTCLIIVAFMALLTIMIKAMSEPQHAHPDAEVNHGRSGGGWGLSTCTEPGCDWTEIY